MPPILIKDVAIVNEGSISNGDVLIRNGVIDKIGTNIQLAKNQAVEEIEARGRYLIPGIIDDQVHFREPGYTYKADIHHESRAAVAGGVTSFMEMPNTNPPTLTQELLEQKYKLAARSSLANYSFYMGTSHDNFEEVLKTNPANVCGVKIFMGSSTGNMLVSDENELKKLFSSTPMLIAVHCEDEATIKRNYEKYSAIYQDAIPLEYHPDIRDAEACYKSSQLAVKLAKEYGTRLHILHLSTKEELALFEYKKPLPEKKITSEVCVHHLWFDRFDYDLYGNRIKCNPAIKELRVKSALLEGLLSDKLDIIATDHAPHTLEEKKRPYFKAPAGIPLVQHGLNIMLTFFHQGKISLEKIVEKMCHNPAICFQISNRGFIREGYHADLALIDVDRDWIVSKENILYKCRWSPFETYNFKGKVTHTFINGHLVYEEGKFNESKQGQRLSFERN